MQLVNGGFEVVYTSLSVPENPIDCSVIVARARQSMVHSRRVKKAGVPMFFARTDGGAAFSVRAGRADVLEAMPLSYGSAVGHFGIFERGSVVAV